MRPPVLVTGPTQDVVSLQDLKDHCRVDWDSEDDLIRSLQNSAVSYLDGWHGILGRAIMPQTWSQDFDDWGCLRLYVGDVQSATVTYQDDGGNDVSLADFNLLYDGQGAYIAADGPSTTSITVEYVAQMNDAQIPAIELAVKMLVGHWFEHREATTEYNAIKSPWAVDALIAPLRAVTT